MFTVQDIDGGRITLIGDEENPTCIHITPHPEDEEAQTFMSGLKVGDKLNISVEPEGEEQPEEEE